jgi:hypothetical protein
MFFLHSLSSSIYTIFGNIILSYYVFGLVCQVPKYHERIHKKYDTMHDLVCIVLIYLFYIAKDLAKKMNPTMVVPLAVPLAAWLL